jgi:hypothetical protein
MDKELTPKQQTSEAVRQAETILILTGQHPSIDQVASTIALTTLLRKFGKKVTAVISDDIPASARFLPTDGVDRAMGGLRDFIMHVDLGRAEVDKLKYTIEDGKLNVHITPFSGGFQPRDVSFGYGEYEYDLIIALGVPSYNRLDKIYAQNSELLRKIPLANIDFHRSNEQYGAINLIEGTAASLAEILMALSESLQAGLIDEKVATIMLTGLMASTDRFTATHTTAKTMTVAAQMMAMGADQQKVVKALYPRERDTNRERRPASQPQTQPQTARNEATAPVRPLAQVVQQAPAPVAAPAQPQPTPTPQPEAAQPRSEQPASPVADFRVAPRSRDESQPPVASAPRPEPPTQPQAPVSSQPSPMQELLPPDHIELSQPPEEPRTPTPQPDESEQLLPPADVSSAEPEPLINDNAPNTTLAPAKAVNPTNNPVFAQRLDDFEY